MKKTGKICWLLVLGFLAACGGARQLRPVTLVELQEVIVQLPAESAAPIVFDWTDMDIFRPGLIATEQAVLDGPDGASMYNLRLEIAPEMDLLWGKLAVRYTNRETVDLNEVYFRLYPNVSGGRITVSNVLVDGQGVTPSLEAADSALRVPLPAPLAPGKSLTISMDFVDELPTEMGGNYGLFGFFENVLVLDTFYPTIAVYDDTGWNVEVPPPDGDWSYYDASFYVVEVTASADLVLVASGREVSRMVQEDQQLVTFAAGPARDFYLAGSTDFMVVSQQVGETIVNSYALSAWPDGAALALEIASEALRIFGERFGVYPYSEFDVVSTPMLALGIEYPGITGITLRAYDLKSTLYGSPARVMLETTVAHEVGHQWFYNAVGNDQVDEPWLDEALVQYITSLYYLDRYGEDAAQSYRQAAWYGRWDRISREDVPIGLSSGAYEEGWYVPAIYGRGPVFVLTLAETMGQESFETFLYDYSQTYKWEIARGEDFRRMAERQCDCDLESLFAEWVYAE